LIGEPQATMSRRRLLTCALGGAALVSACGSTTTVTRTVTHRVVRAATITMTTRTIATSATSATSALRTGPASDTPPMCLTSDLTLVSLGGSVATGHTSVAFGLRNHSGHACMTGGYPGVLFLDTAGQGLPTVADHTTDDFFGETQLRELTIATGGLVSFRLGVSDVSTSDSDSGCVSVHGLQVIAPNNTASVAISRTFEACGATVSVSPLQAGTAALR
jgi:hypothetical protein